MQVRLTPREIPSTICHFASKDPAKAVELLADWTRDHYSATQSEVAASQEKMHESLKVAATQLKLNASPEVTPTLNGLLTQGFEGGRLIAIPAIGGMVAPAILAVFDDNTCRAFQYVDQALREAPIANSNNKSQVGILLSETSKATVEPKSLDLVVNDYSNGDCFRVTTENRPRQKTTFTSYAGPDVMKTMVIDHRLHDCYVFSGSESFHVNGTSDQKLQATYQGDR